MTNTTTAMTTTVWQGWDGYTHKRSLKREMSAEGLEGGRRQMGREHERERKDRRKARETDVEKERNIGEWEKGGQGMENREWRNWENRKRERGKCV